MSAVRTLTVLAILTPLGGCGIDFHPRRAGDTACLGTEVRDFNVPFYQAIQICETPIPDLTGDQELQQYAQAYDISFRYQPALDAAIKRRDWTSQLLVGSHIPQDYSLDSAEIAPR